MKVRSYDQDAVRRYMAKKKQDEKRKESEEREARKRNKEIKEKQMQVIIFVKSYLVGEN